MSSSARPFLSALGGPLPKWHRWWRQAGAVLWLTSLLLTVPYKSWGKLKNFSNPGSSPPLYFFSSGILRTPWEKRVLKPKIGNKQVSTPLNRTVGIPGFDCAGILGLSLSTSPSPTNKKKRRKLLSVYLNWRHFILNETNVLSLQPSRCPLHMERPRAACQLSPGSWTLAISVCNLPCSCWHLSRLSCAPFSSWRRAPSSPAVLRGMRTAS